MGFSSLDKFSSKLQEYKVVLKSLNPIYIASNNFSDIFIRFPVFGAACIIFYVSITIILIRVFNFEILNLFKSNLNYSSLLNAFCPFTIQFFAGIVILIIASISTAKFKESEGNGFFIGPIIGILTAIKFGITYGFTIGVAFGIAFMSIGLISNMYSGGLILSMIWVIAYGIYGGIPNIIPEGIALGLSFCTVMNLYDKSEDYIFGLITCNCIGFSIILFFSGLNAIGYSAIVLSIIISMRIYYYPIHFIFICFWNRGSWYEMHPIHLDDSCIIPLPFFYHLLILYTVHSPKDGEREIKRLISTYPTAYRKSALKARVILILQKTCTVQNLSELDDIVIKLPEGETGYPSKTQRIKESVYKITALQARLNTSGWPLFRQTYSNMLCEEIENFRYTIKEFPNHIYNELNRASENWIKIAKNQHEEIRKILSKEPIPQIFRAGDPIDLNDEAFVLRESVISKIEAQIMMSRGCPGIVMYGRRRTGKTTILHNISNFLPPSVIPVIISMQDPHYFTSVSIFFKNLANEIQKLFSKEQRVENSSIGLIEFSNILEECNRYLEEQNKRLLLCIDEYENIDNKIGEKTFNEDLLAVIRESIQSHRRITWILAGSHEITELSHAPWTSYLISARTIEIPLFTLAETRLLLTNPLKHSSFWQKCTQGSQPFLNPEFWGIGGIEKIHNEAGGWPHLLQLIAETVIELLNNEDNIKVTEELLEVALDEAVVKGHNVLYDLMHRECQQEAEWQYIYNFINSPIQSAPYDKEILRSLKHRLLIEEIGDKYKLRVPLMERWLKQRG